MSTTVKRIRVSRWVCFSGHEHLSRWDAEDCEIETIERDLLYADKEPEREAQRKLARKKIRAMRAEARARKAVRKQAAKAKATTTRTTK